MDEDLFRRHTQNALTRAYFFLRFRSRTEKEMRDYLQKKAERFGWTSAVVDSAISCLKENNFINDGDFVKRFIEQRNISKPKSAYALQNELMRFGVEKQLISAYFQENPQEEDDLAFKALEKKWRSFRFMEKKDRFQKAAYFLSRRGFSFEIIKNSIQRLENNE